jgi:hypothetical protein
MPDSPEIDEFRERLDDLDAAFPASICDHAANENYADLRDEILVYVDEHPEVQDEARDAGLPVD